MSEDQTRRVIRPVILAGGAGTRLWPLSTAARPKHLLPLLGEQSLFEETLARFKDGFSPPMIVANRAQENDLRALAPGGARLLFEPVKRDSAAAIALAAAAAGDEDLLLVCPSDHHIADVAAFHAAIEVARPVAEAGRIVTFGIEPDHPATGFGYIAAGPGEGVREVARFVEKPPLDRAEAMIAEGGHYWNAGIFLATALTWREELAAFAPAILAAASEAVDHARADGPVLHVDAEAFARSPAQSIDYAVMEHSRRVSVVPVAMGWSDIGSWTALFDAAAKDDDGNVLGAGTIAIDAHANLIRTSGPRVAVIGVDDLVIIATPEAVLVARLSEAQRVREAADWFDAETKR
jgi:mannose-1-phosphate guanylyltransferase/mannose-6-phosphate isomerase